MPDADATAPARAGGPPRRRRTLLVMAEDRVEPRPLPATGSLVIGRGADVDVRIQHGSVSRRHLILRLGEDAIEVIDLGGANGVYLRGVRLPTGVAVAIAPNEAIHVGELTLVVQELVAGAGGGAEAVEAQPSGPLARRAAPVVIDPATRRLYELAARVARGSISVLLLGETGTGKEVLADFVHGASPRAAGPLVRVNCAALSESLIESELFGHEAGAFTGAARLRPGLLETAAGGTVLLDEVGELPAAAQAKLLRAVEEGAVTRVGGARPIAIDVRFLAATHRDLEADVEAGRFRRDLYFRLAGATLALPPLRARPDEILALAEAFARDAAARLGRGAPRLAEDAIAALRRHAWPGNARELRNAIERAVLLADGDVLHASHLALATPPIAPPAPAPATPAAPPSTSADAPLADQLVALERDRILDALAACHGNQTRAAAQLGMPRRTLVKRLAQYGVPRPRKP